MPTFFVNKERVDIAATVPGDTPLLWVLRDHLNLTGTKYGCGMALCGACTVYIEGQPTRSCQVPLSSIKTGDRDHDDRGPEDEGGAGGPGGVGEARRAAVRLLPERTGDGGRRAAREKKKPTDADIDAAMSGNLCRCATYVRIRAAIHEAAKSLA